MLCTAYWVGRISILLLSARASSTAAFTHFLPEGCRESTKAFLGGSAVACFLDVRFPIRLYD